MTEIQGKLILARVNARFKLARVRVIRSPLYDVFVINFYNASRIEILGNTQVGFQL